MIMVWLWRIHAEIFTVEGLWYLQVTFKWFRQKERDSIVYVCVWKRDRDGASTNGTKWVKGMELFYLLLRIIQILTLVAKKKKKKNQHPIIFHHLVDQEFGKGLDGWLFYSMWHYPESLCGFQLMDGLFLRIQTMTGGNGWKAGFCWNPLPLHVVPSSLCIVSPPG